jgi:hypothetical protein
MSITTTIIPSQVTQFTAAEAITAVEGEATLVLAGDVTIVAGKALSVDTISEITAGAGVTTDGLISKDGSLTPTAGKGIDFSNQANPAAGMTGELLDHYEKGTWTPGIGDNGLNGSAEGQGYGAQTGRYTKIGNRLFVQGYVEISSLGTLTTSEGARITGLPFASVNVSNVIAAISCGIAGSLAMPASNQSVTGFLQANESVFTLRLWDTSTGNTSLLVSEVSAGGTLGFSGSYEV